jgi:hypothetical protein
MYTVSCNYKDFGTKFYNKKQKSSFGFYVNPKIKVGLLFDYERLRRINIKNQIEIIRLIRMKFDANSEKIMSVPERE